MKKINNTRLLLYIKGAVLLLLSILIIRYSKESIERVAVFMGSGLIIIGIALLLISLELKKQEIRWSNRFAEGLVDIVFGFFLVGHPSLTADIIPIFTGFWIIFYGILMLAGSLELYDDIPVTKKGFIIFSIVTILLGFVVSFNPVTGTISVEILISISILFVAIANILFAVYFGKIKRTSPGK